MVRQLALSYLDAQIPTKDRAVSGRVRVALERSLGTGATTVAATARLLAMSPRTVQRRLADEGTNFGTILDDVRKQRALHLLAESDLPLAQIASVVGLSSPTTLSQYARRWWATTARDVRHYSEH